MSAKAQDLIHCMPFGAGRLDGRRERGELGGQGDWRSKGGVRRQQVVGLDLGVTLALNDNQQRLRRGPTGSALVVATTRIGRVQCRRSKQESNAYLGALRIKTNGLVKEAAGRTPCQAAEPCTRTSWSKHRQSRLPFARQTCTLKKSHASTEGLAMLMQLR